VSEAAEEKSCTKCGETKPLEEFIADKRTPDGRRNSCRECGRTAAKAAYERRVADDGYRENRNANLRAYNAEFFKDDKRRAHKNARYREWLASNPDARDRYRSAWRDLYMTDTEFRAKFLADMKIRRENPDYKDRKNKREKERRDTDPEYRERYYGYQRIWREGRRENEQFDAFMARMEEDAIAFIGPLQTFDPDAGDQ